MLVVILLVIAAGVCGEQSGNKNKKPNLILIVADDLGYGDLYHTGHPTQERNELDELAEEGIRFTHYMATERSCSPNRAAMLTGRYAVRSGVHGAVSPVFLPMHSTGLPKSEVTMPEALKDLGYRTGMIGKWNLGKMGLAVYHSLPTASARAKVPWCFLYNGSEIIEQPYNTDTLTEKMVKDARHFIRTNKDNKFFFYVASPQPHDITYSGPKFQGKSKRGLVGDAINEMAWMVGEIIDEVKRHSLERNTLVMFVNDHGAGNWQCQPDSSTGPFVGMGGTSWEGAWRGPAIAWWPGRLKKGRVSSTIVSSMDVFPTFLFLAGDARYLKKRKIVYDGKIIQDFVRRRELENEDRFLVLYCNDRIMAARFNQYKAHFYTKTITLRVNGSNPFCDFSNIKWVTGQLSCSDAGLTARNPPLLFNTDADPAESYPLDVEQYWEIMEEINFRLKKHKKTVTVAPGLTNVALNHALVPCCSPPTCICE